MLDPDKALAEWSWKSPVRPVPAPSGLINRTWVVWSESGPQAVLQWLNTSIFRPEVHEDIDAVTSHVAERGLLTPRLVRTRAGRLWHTDDDGQVWRCLTHLGDRTIEKVSDAADAMAAAMLVGRFHTAVGDLDWQFHSLRGFHDTQARMNDLAAAVPRHTQHRLHDEVARLADAILDDWRRFDSPTDLPRRIVHGDLKISNVRFAGREAVALIDLDTLGYGTLDAELGDALRSWCNPSSEDSAHPAFALDIFEAAMQGYACTGSATEGEWQAILPGVERIALELASRFAKDALEESYFGFDPKFGGRGEHNLVRASGQYALARAVRTARREAEQALLRARRR